MAPSIYMATAVEVVRRRAFSDQYLKKATSIADTFCTLHDEELSLRMNFQVINILIRVRWVVEFLILWYTISLILSKICMGLKEIAVFCELT